MDELAFRYGLAKTIKQVRGSETQRRFASRLNVSQAYVSQLESCARSPSLLEFIKICDALDVLPQEVISEIKRNAPLERK